MPSKHTLLEKAQGSWDGHVLRTNDQGIPNVPLFGELGEGKRKIGQFKLRFKDILKTTLKTLETPVEAWEDLTLK